MNGLTYTIDAEIFHKFPAFQRGVVLAFDVNNGPTPAELTERIRAEEAALRTKLDLATLTEYPRIRSWRESFRAIGMKPADFRPSIEAMARRVLRGDQLPAINTLVDLGNLISLQYIVPVGGHSMDHLRQNIELRPARGDEDFVPFGTDTLEHPVPGEFVFVEGNVVLTRRWVWRQGNHTLTLPETKTIEINVDVLPPVTQTELEEICNTTAALVTQFCGGRTRWEILAADHPSMSLVENPMG